MSQVSPVTISAATPSGAAGVSVPGPEKNASQSATPSPRPTPATASPAKLRSCAVCRTRKVRCNKESPCSNCRRANIPCVFPSADRPPRWARRLERITSNAAQVANPEAEQVMERIRNLESLVKQLSGQLEQAHAAAHSPHDSSRVISSGSSPHDQRPDHQIDAPFPTVTSTENFQKQFGRLVLKDASRSRYISSGFWSRINDELDGLKMETRGLAGETSDTSEDESSQSAEKSLPTQELERTPSERHAFLFRHNLNPAGPDLREFQPLPSQVPFLLDVFSENVNLLYQIVHMPTVRSMAPSSRGRNSNTTTLTLANEALLFSIYYAAITSMEEDDIMMNFGSTKANLNLKYRLGLEHALAAADFLNAPELVLVQAFSIFLFLVRRHDSPRYVWMMTGLLIRMAQALGMHRDGSHFHHLTPFEVEMRRRVWWVVCILDVRASEDQGIDLTISSGSFDTRTPINLNDADISPDTKITPTECQGFTDMTFPMLSIEMCEITRRMMAGPPGFEEQSRLLNEMNDKSEHGYLQYSADSANICYWVGVICMRLLVAKMTLITHLPVLFSSPSEHFSDEIRDKLLVSAIEVAEHNHALNSEHACHHWRWVYQTFTHWHVIVYLLIEMTRRPWSSIVERAWVNLHSPWLIPVQSNRNLRIWVPLRKLMAKARKHRAAEVQRLRGDAGAARQLEIDDRKLPVPKSACSFSAVVNGDSSTAEACVDSFRERWRILLAMTDESGLKSGQGSEVPAVIGNEPQPDSTVPYGVTDLDYRTGFPPAGQNLANYSTNMGSAVPTSTIAFGQAGTPGPPPYAPFPSGPVDWTGGLGGARSEGVGWLWADADPTVDVFANLDADTSIDVNMDLAAEVDWYNWVELAKVVEMPRDAGPAGSGAN